jgi:hypothetical protein
VKQLQTRIDIKSVWRALGRIKFLQVASVTQKALDANLQPDVIATLISKERTGSRPLLVSARNASQPQNLINGEAIL